MIVMAIAPIGGPLLGGVIIKFSSWPMIFWLLSATGVVMFLALLTLPETLPEERRVRATLKGAFTNYARLLKNWRFMRYTLSLTFYYMAVYAFIAGSPLVYIGYYGISPQHYGWLFAVNIVGVMSLSTLNRKLVQRYSLDVLLKTALSIATVAAILLAWFSDSTPWTMSWLLGLFTSVAALLALTGTRRGHAVPDRR